MLSKGNEAKETVLEAGEFLTSPKVIRSTFACVAIKVVSHQTSAKAVSVWSPWFD
jgi:hypothetical protein